MNFNTHFGRVPAGGHALLSPSNYHWIRYDLDKMDQVFHSAMTAQRGTELHKLAHDLIRLGVKLPETGQTLNLYVNDAIGFRMTSEVVLYYSENCYGTTDCISYNEQLKLLRISDLKNGLLEASMEQLLVYAALFCLEYGFKPTEIKIELRIYQNDDVRLHVPEYGDIFHIMEQIKILDRRIRHLRKEATS